VGTQKKRRGRIKPTRSRLKQHQKKKKKTLPSRQEGWARINDADGEQRVTGLVWEKKILRKENAGRESKHGGRRKRKG